MLGLDTIRKENMSQVSIPKFNNKVVNNAMFDRDTHARIPAARLFEEVTAEDGTFAHFDIIKLHNITENSATIWINDNDNN